MHLACHHFRNSVGPNTLRNIHSPKVDGPTSGSAKKCFSVTKWTIWGSHWDPSTSNDAFVSKNVHSSNVWVQLFVDTISKWSFIDWHPYTLSYFVSNRSFQQPLHTSLWPFRINYQKKLNKVICHRCQLKNKEAFRLIKCNSMTNRLTQFSSE